LSGLYRLNKTKEASNFIQQRLQQINSNSECLKAIADQQFYSLCHWQEAEHRINYRRFFLVNGLICLNIQDEKIFDHYHQLIKSLVAEGAFTGLRIDHIDGLYDPAGYLDRLRKLTGGKLYQVVEKILEPGETLPAQLTSEGTTGYDFLALVDNLFTNQKNAEQFVSFYVELADEYTPVNDQIYDKKTFILERFMAGELNNLYNLLLTIIDKRLLAPLHKEDLRSAIAGFLVCCPVYRYYPDNIPFNDENTLAIKKIIAQMRERGRARKEATDLLEKLFLEMPTHAGEELKKRILHFYRRCMQFTGPLMAKGVEDTLMYTYNSFIVHNEVGDSSLLFGIKVNEFNQAMIERQKNWPLTLNATSTHDTKRGEDVRARLNVLSDIPGEWFEVVSQWREMNQSLKQNSIPAPTEEYFIYQSLVGAYPMHTCTHDSFVTRFEAYLIKSLREAKMHSGWEKPNEEYESTCIEFLRKLLKTDSLFMKSFIDFHRRIVDFGIVNSLAQVLLKFTCPGIPDTYQGCENWDLSFVDPDNRRPVDFNHHLELLNALDAEGKEKLLESLWKKRYTGQVKLWLTQTLLRLRKQQAEFFKNAAYVPLDVEGEFSDFAFAFARNEGPEWLIVVIPLHLAELCKQQGTDDIFSVDWRDTHVILPDRLNQAGIDIFFARNIEAKRELPIKKLFRGMPLGLLRFESATKIRNKQQLTSG
jgi:malto-oligosyltrehalose synthase